MRLVPTSCWLLIVVFTTATTGAACGGDEEPSGAGAPLQVVAGFLPLAEAVERVGGDRVVVEDLTPAGAEPHDVELSTDQVEAIEDADLVVVLGGDFQPAVEAVAERRDGPTLVVLDELDLPADGPEDDPHVWLDPTLMAAIVTDVEAALGELDPDGADDAAERAEGFRDELDALDASYETSLADCERRTIVVAHEAFGWLAARYDLEQEGIAGLSPEAEPDPERLAELADLVDEEGVTTVFTESLLPREVADALAREAGVGVAVLDPIEGIAEADRAAGASYATVMADDLEVLVEALGCA